VPKLRAQNLTALDTKYKVGDKVASEDVAQVVTYADLKGTRTALLVYPHVVDNRFHVSVGQIRVGTVAFPLGTDLEAAGTAFLNEVLASGADSLRGQGDASTDDATSS
jgi:deoxyribose-phosphate aldolase